MQKNKRIISLSVVIVLLVGLIINLYNYKSENVLKNSIISKKNNGMLTMMFEKEDEAGVYEADDEETSFDQSSYYFNPLLSGCEHGGSVSYTNNKVTMESAYTDKCFVYFSTTEVSDGEGSASDLFVSSTAIIIAEFDYTGDEQSVIVSRSGYYKLEVWGAQGGSVNDSYNGGYGGYSVGVVNLNSGETLYVNVGGSGSSAYQETVAGGYNGGGAAISPENSNVFYNSGGGATHIATVTKSNEDSKTGELKFLESYKGTLHSSGNYYVSDEILIVAGGGGGVFYLNDSITHYSTYGGSGGGYIGVAGYSTYNNRWDNPKGHAGYSYGGTQTAPNVSSIDNNNLTDTEYGSFGQGASQGTTISAPLAGGGGGFYGGNISGRNSGGGGSGYIASSRLVSGGNVIKHMAVNGATGDYLSDNTETKTIASINTSEIPLSDYAKKGNGYARITYCGSSASDC